MAFVFFVFICVIVSLCYRWMSACAALDLVSLLLDNVRLAGKITCPKWPTLCQVGRQTSTQSLSQETKDVFISDPVSPGCNQSERLARVPIGRSHGRSTAHWVQMKWGQVRWVDMNAASFLTVLVYDDDDDDDVPCPVWQSTTPDRWTTVQSSTFSTGVNIPSPPPPLPPPLWRLQDLLG